LKVYRARFEAGENRAARPGEILRVLDAGISVACAKDSLVLEEVQPEGKRIMTAGEFISGYKVASGERLGL
jgi:methionyl-tRNA formyltransferase